MFLLLQCKVTQCTTGRIATIFVINLTQQRGRRFCLDARSVGFLSPMWRHCHRQATDREDLIEKVHYGSSILNFETVAPLADECAVLADC